MLKKDLKFSNFFCIHDIYEFFYHGFLSRSESVGEVLDIPLFIGKDNEDSLTSLIFRQFVDAVQLFEESVHVNILNGQEKLSVSVQAFTAFEFSDTVDAGWFLFDVVMLFMVKNYNI